MRILIIEDDIEAAEAMKRGLTEAGFECEHASDGEFGLEAARAGEFNVLIVDRMMPRRDGVSVVETLRREGDATPVLFLSAMGEIDDRVVGLKHFPTSEPPRRIGVENLAIRIARAD